MNDQPTPQNKGQEELSDGVMLELRDVARKAQVDYVAVNHPNGVRSGESSELLAEFLKVNHERIMELFNQELEAKVKKAVSDYRFGTMSEKGLNALVDDLHFEQERRRLSQPKESL